MYLGLFGEQWCRWGGDGGVGNVGQEVGAVVSQGRQYMRSWGFGQENLGRFFNGMSVWEGDLKKKAS